MGQVQPSYLSNMKSQRLKSRFRNKGHPNIFYLPYLKPNRFKYYVMHQGTSRDQFKLPIYQTCNHIRLFKSNLKSNRFKDYATHQRISRDKFKLSNSFILPNTKPNTFKTRLFQYFHFTANRLAYHVSCFASRDNFKHLIYQTCKHIDKNLIFMTRVNPILYKTK